MDRAARRQARSKDYSARSAPGGASAGRSFSQRLKSEYAAFLAQIEGIARQEDRSLARLQNLPDGLDGVVYQWVDLNGEGLAGMLTQQAGSWFYKPNLGNGRLGAMQLVGSQPSLANLRSQTMYEQEHS